MKKNIFLLFASTSLTAVITLGVIRWLAPQLLGIPIDLQAVQVSKEMPPFFEGVFGISEEGKSDFLLKDPYTNVRGKPFYYVRGGAGPNSLVGPHDLLGFRNRNIPNVADVVTIGDSQTYGTNAQIQHNWPGFYNRYAAQTLGYEINVYNMSTGGWSAPQYLQMLEKSLPLQPQVIIISFYTGNDPREAVSVTYSSDRWKSFQSKKDDLNDKPPSASFPSKPEESQYIKFSDNIATTFTPKLRLMSNDNNYGVVRAGYRILSDIGKRIDSIIATKFDKNLDLAPLVVFTIIPTKELVYAKKVEKEGVNISAEYRKLVRVEGENIKKLSDSFKKLKNIKYIDLLDPLQKVALEPMMLYPTNYNGHPYPPGYEKIALHLLEGTINAIAKIQIGLNEYSRPDGKKEYYLFGGRSFVQFKSQELIIKNGWQIGDDIPIITQRELVQYPLIGTINEINPGMYGPAK